MPDPRVELFQAMLGTERFWRFITVLTDSDKLRFWQEEELGRFAEKHSPPLPTRVTELRALFAASNAMPGWGNVDSIRNSVMDPAALSVGDESHRRSLLALTSAERRPLLNHSLVIDKVRTIAVQLAEEKRIDEALRLFDDLVETANEYTLDVFVDALGLASPDRVERYFERALRNAEMFTEIYIAAARLRLRHGDRNGAVALVREAIRHGHDPALIEPQLQVTPPGVVDPHWAQPAALHELRELSEAGELEDLDCDILPGLLSPALTAEWFKAWSGRSGGKKLRPFAIDGSGGYVCFSLERSGAGLEAQPIAFFGSEGEQAVLARDFADFLATLALGIGPHALCESGAKAQGKKLKAVAAILATHYPAAVKRSLKTIVADAKS